MTERSDTLGTLEIYKPSLLWDISYLIKTWIPPIHQLMSAEPLKIKCSHQPSPDWCLSAEFILAVCRVQSVLYTLFHMSALIHTNTHIHNRAGSKHFSAWNLEGERHFSVSVWSACTHEDGSALWTSSFKSKPLNRPSPLLIVVPFIVSLFALLVLHITVKHERIQLIQFISILYFIASNIKYIIISITLCTNTVMKGKQQHSWDAFKVTEDCMSLQCFFNCNSAHIVKVLHHFLKKLYFLRVSRIFTAGII